MRHITNNRIIGFGDSITYGSCVEQNENWLSVLDEYLESKTDYQDIEVINRGVGGNTSREGLVRFQTI